LFPILRNIFSLAVVIIMQNSPVPLSPPPPNNDQQHLKLLSIFHYVMAGLSGVGTLLSFSYIGLGAMFVSMPESMTTSSDDLGATGIGWIFLVIGIIWFLVGLAFTICLIVCGRCLSRRTGYWFTVILAGVQCLSVPLGTALGVCTLIVLLRDSVKVLYGVKPPVA
jgi:hypothetical protein